MNQLGKTGEFFVPPEYLDQWDHLTSKAKKNEEIIQELLQKMSQIDEKSPDFTE